MLQLRADDNNGTTRVNTLAEQVLTETTLLASLRPETTSADGCPTAAATATSQGGRMRFSLLTMIRGTQLEQTLESGVAVDDATVAEVGGRRPPSSLNHGAQVR